MTLLLSLYFTSIIRHISSIPTSMFLSLLPCLTLFPPGWFLSKPRQEFCLWCPGISPGAVTWQHCPPLRAPCCCNYLWHPCSGASTQVTWKRVWMHGVERRKQKSVLCSQHEDVRHVVNPTSITRIKTDRLTCYSFKKTILVTCKTTSLTCTCYK